MPSRLNRFEKARELESNGIKLNYEQHHILLGQLVVAYELSGNSRRVHPLLEEAKVSPKGRYAAELTQGDTGAVGGWMSAIRISQVGPSFLARLEGRTGETVFGVLLPSSHIDAAWVGDTELFISCAGCTKESVLVQKSSWNDVKITYGGKQ